MMPDTALPLYTVAQLRDIERAAQAGLPPHTLMARAGRAAATWLRRRLQNARGELADAPVLLLAGPGNNGGDALVAATELHRQHIPVEVWLLAPPAADDAQWAHAGALAAGVPITPVPATLPAHRTFRWGVDGLFGIGLSRAVTGRAAELIAWFNAQPFARLALDIPSGLDAEHGAPPSPDGAWVVADATLSFLGATPGLFTALGRDAAGGVSVDTLDIPPGDTPTAPRARLNHPSLFTAHWPRRHHASHKGTYGALGVLGGHSGMLGAPVLASRAALHAGAGRVYTGFLAPQFPPYDSVQPELMMRAAESLDAGTLQAIAAGPGLGDDTDAAMCLAHLLAAQPAALVLDADALNLLAGKPDWQRLLSRRTSPAVLTPHPLEAARLLGCTAADVQADRLAAAREIAFEYGAIAVLKGSGTVIDDGRRTYVNPTGNAGLATAGTGDVLTGIVGALLAQGMPPLEAAAAAVWVHGKAAEHLVERGIGPLGLTASELLVPVRSLLNSLSHSMS